MRAFNNSRFKPKWLKTPQTNEVALPNGMKINPSRLRSVSAKQYATPQTVDGEEFWAYVAVVAGPKTSHIIPCRDMLVAVTLRDQLASYARLRGVHPVITLVGLERAELPLT